jgi:hypothetical protein
MPGLVPVTLTDTLIAVSPLTTLPELGAVKHTVTEYVPDGEVLVAQGLIGSGVAVGVGGGVLVGVGVGVEVGVARGVLVGFGVGLPFE